MESIIPHLDPTCEASPTHRRGTSSNQVWECRLWEKPGGVLPSWTANQTNHLSESLAGIKTEGSARKADFPGRASQLHCHSSRQVTYGCLPTCIQTNQLWPADSRSYHICESETTSGLPAWWAVQGTGAEGCLLLGYWAFPTTPHLPVYHHGDLGEVLLSWVDTGQTDALGLQMLLPAGKHTYVAAGLPTAPVSWPPSSHCFFPKHSLNSLWFSSWWILVENGKGRHQERDPRKSFLTWMFWAMFCGALITQGSLCVFKFSMSSSKKR